jgi:hypothetical protein
MAPASTSHGAKPDPPKNVIKTAVATTRKANPITISNATVAWSDPVSAGCVSSTARAGSLRFPVVEADDFPVGP